MKLYVFDVCVMLLVPHAEMDSSKRQEEYSKVAIELAEATARNASDATLDHVNCFLLLD